MNDKTAKRRVVAIVGRPNVGKSAIFNRLTGARIAIVHQTSGVTRDRLMREVSWGNERFELVDTGGLGNMRAAAASDEIEAGIQKQVHAALEDAAVAILTVDVEAGVHPLDQEVAGLLRKSGCFTVVAVNKADNATRDEDASEFDRLGYSTFPVSALHDRGFDALMETVMRALPEGENETISNPLKVAVVGRPNVGKSSYINRLLKNDRLIVSNVPGTTRDSIDVPFIIGTGPQARHYLLVDTAGMRHPGKVNSSLDKFSQMRAEKSIERSDIVIVMIDGSDRPVEMDKRIVGAVLEGGKGCVVLVSKWDLARQTERAYEKELRWALPFANYCPVVFVSSKSGYNVRRAIDVIDHVSSQIRITLPTSILNRTILDAYDKVQPHVVGGKRFNIYYCTQTGSCPVRVRMFVNDPRIVEDAYRKYLERVLRSRFGLEGAPIFLHFSGRNKPR